MLIGVVGKPNVGKSTFFKAVTLSEIKIGNYPFVTIEVNEAIGYVRTNCVEKYFNVKCNPRQGFCRKGKRFVPVKLMDVAGLVPGAHSGKGLGNKFLDDLRQADVLIHVIDISGSTNDQGEPVPVGSYDPLNDVRFLEDELNMWIYNILLKNWNKFVRQVKASRKPSDRAISEHFSGLKINLNMVKRALDSVGLPKDLSLWKEKDIRAFAVQLRIYSKPIIIAANKVDVNVDLANKNLTRLKTNFKNYKIIPCSSESELALREADKKNMIEYTPGDPTFKKLNKKLTVAQEDALKFIQKRVLNKFKSTGVQVCLDIAVFEELKYIPIFPGGVGKLTDSEGRVLPDVFLLPPKSTALDFAYLLHTDFGDNFVRAIDVKTKRIIGRDHKLSAGDVIEIISTK